MNKAQIFYYVAAVAIITCEVYLYTSSDAHAPVTNPDLNFNNSTTNDVDLTPENSTTEATTSNGIDMAVVTEEKYSLIDSNWRWLRTESATGTIINEPLTTAPFLLTLSSDKTMNSQTDCNMVNGTYSQNGDNLIFGPLMATKMFCELSIESKYTEQLSLVESFSITDNMLRLNLSNEMGVMFFVRTR